MLVLRTLFDGATSTYSYLVGDEAAAEAILIDPVFERVDRDAIVLRELGMRLVATIDTHVHADHVTGAWLHKSRARSAIVGFARSGATGLDRKVAGGDRIAFGDRWLSVRETPGHTSGCISLVLDDESRVFTGDCLLIRGTGRADLQGGDARTLHRSIRHELFTLGDACVVHPGHDYRGLSTSTIGEERRSNPRVGGESSEDDFVRFAEHLGLAPPRAIERAVPANLVCGRPEHEPPSAPTWADLAPTLAGVWEISPDVLEAVRSRVIVVDVREPDELRGELGAIAGSVAMPLGQLASRAAELGRERPLVCVCRSGTRSGRAAAMLTERGITDVANLAGGLIRWRAEGHPVIGGAE